MKCLEFGHKHKMYYLCAYMYDLFAFFFQIIAYDRRRGGTIVIDKRETETVTSLIISQADQTDSGRYTCDPASSYPQSIMVHVTKGNIYRKPFIRSAS